MAKIKEVFANPTKIINALLVRVPALGTLLGDANCLKIRFKAVYGKTLHLDKPQTFNEKLQWLKLYDRRPIYTDMVDKYAVKDYVAKKIGEEYVIPTLGVWNSVDEIDFDGLPNQFVLKCTHDSGGIVICKDKAKLDITLAKKKLAKTLKKNFYYSSYEWPYKNVKPRIIAEKYMEDPKVEELRDYKFYTFNGIPYYLLLATNRQSAEKPLSFDYYDMDFNHLPITNFWHPNNYEGQLQKPLMFEKMKELSKILAEGIPHVRVDFYEVDGMIYFGEMTFFPNGGYLKLSPDSWEKEWGDLIHLPLKNS